MNVKIIFGLIVAIVFASCTYQDTTLPDDLNRRAYLLRYVDVDSSLHYADKAYSSSKNYVDGQTEAISHRAFARYQQMRYTKALKELDKIDSISNNQVELLCADVMRMKISQRTGELRIFYRAWHSAQRHLRRIDEELHLLTEHHKDRVLYARTEMHIIASTYYFYSQQDSASRAELKNIESYMLIPRDTSQWCNYMYMVGAGGMLTGDSTVVLLKEFDNLTHVLTIARRTKDKYFQANSLQALSLMLESPIRRELIKNLRGGGMDFIVGQFSSKSPSFTEDSLSLSLANHSLQLFRDYGDRFQTANVLRTKAELLFRQKRYNEALEPLQEALELVSEQHRIEPKRVPYWEASIYERLSLTYSALGNNRLAGINRMAYLSLLEATRQDLEEEARAEELQQYNKRLHINLSFIVALVLIVIVSFWILLRKVKRYSKRQEREAEELLLLTKEEICAREMELARKKLANIERRAKVSLAENVVPYINRMLNTQDLDYVAELSTEILHINNILTEWILVKRGKVAMNITTFPLEPLLNTISKNKAIYNQKGLVFDILPVGPNVLVKADRALTLFMINTLCDNARKFTPSGGKISISIDTTDTTVTISVIDNGCGISKENVDKINNSKVFKITSSNSNNSGALDGTGGFGFGLMNCKGIIGQMKKISTRFQCCEFGVESTEGKGSRFWFRLPRVLSVLVFICCFCSNTLARIDTDFKAAKEYYDLLFQGNASSNFNEALEFGERALELVPADSIYLHMHIHNEMAIASQALCLWDKYAHHNFQCVRLHRQLTADPNLPVYAQRLHLVKSEISWSLFFTLMLFLSSLFVLVLVVRRSRKKRGEMQRHEDILLGQQEKKNRIQFELDRIHIQNQILDNCLSTIKHETMYYPARIQQMALSQRIDREDLFQLVNYYNDIYTILLEQAQRQTAIKLALDESVLAELKRRIMSSISNAPVTVSLIEHKSTQEIRIKVIGVDIPNNLFTAEAGNLDAFVAREIVRMHDAACGFPGLRLYVENNEIIITLWKNSRLLSSKTFSWN